MNENQILCDVVACAATRFQKLNISMNSKWMYIGRHAIQKSDDALVNIVAFCESLKEQAYE